MTFETAETVGSATLVAMMLTVCACRMAAGAVYAPFDETEPTAGTMDQVTALFSAFVTLAAKIWLCVACSAVAAGASKTLGRVTVYVPLAGMLLTPATTEIARTIVLADKEMGPEYMREALVGALPSVV